MAHRARGLSGNREESFAKGPTRALPRPRRSESAGNPRGRAGPGVINGDVTSGRSRGLICEINLR